jgi:signal transduction histidine kinase
MFGLRLKLSMAVYLALLLLSAMVLISLVTVISTRDQLVGIETERGHLLVAAVDACVDLAPSSDDFLFDQNFIGHIRDILHRSGYGCLLVRDSRGRRLNLGAVECARRFAMDGAAVRALEQRKGASRLVGSTWGILWKQPGYLVISEPVVRDGRVLGAIAVAGGLDGLYRELRRRLPYLMGYLLVNTIFLSLIGLYKLSRLTVNPLQRLVRRAEGFQGEDGTFFLPDQRANEFNRLSLALNRMLERIQADRRTLRHTVASLEKANQDLKQMQNEIVRAEKLATAGRLSAGIAHEIGNPIGIAMGYMELLKQADLPEDEKTDCIEKTEAELARIDTIIRQLLDFSRPAAESSVEPVAVHGVLREIADVFRMQPLTADIRLRLDLKAPVDTVRADAGQLRQVFLNLMINAADAIGAASRSGGRLEIKSREAGEGGTPAMLEIQFADNGPGIAPENLGSIFDPFFTTKEPGRGTGLGLSVSIMLVENMGGRMAVDSRPGEGTIMRVLLPLEPEDDPKAGG